MKQCVMCNRKFVRKAYSDPTLCFACEKSAGVVRKTSFMNGNFVFYDGFL